jgi:hypothetical protein
MPAQARAEAEAAIKSVLLQEWDPLGVHELPGPHGEYDTHAHEVYDLLARGASDVQVERYLHHIERDDLHHPELATRDLGPVLRKLRDLERTII